MTATTTTTGPGQVPPMGPDVDDDGLGPVEQPVRIPHVLYGNA